jgi:hypothetical protein
MSPTLIELARERGWTPKRLLDLALAFIARKGLGEEFDTYLTRAAKHDREKAEELQAILKTLPED